ncbi:MAG: hypothetical protein EAX95_01060 [Candidatus Thorarchaeota archaeon]|nr:hypothetical protein [Candidatus Thorarchaeota archaeon]
MKLSDILQPLRNEVETDDSVRELALPLARAAVRKCSESIKETHRGNYEAAAALLEEAMKKTEKAKQQIENSEFLSSSRNLDTAYQEMAEAANLLSLLRDGVFTPPSNNGIPSRPYLTGLADAIGELRRAVLNSLRMDDIERANTLLEFMEEILDELGTFDFPNALVPELRRKCDVARSLIERTRGDITTAIQQAKLIKELREFESRHRSSE